MVSRCFVIFIFLVANVFAFAHNHSSAQAFKKAIPTPAIIQIITKQADSIQDFDGEKLYLKSEKIFSTPFGLALYDQNSMILLQNLSTNDSGHYLLCRSKDDYRFTCPKCGYQWWFSDTWSDLCPRCYTPGE